MSRSTNFVMTFSENMKLGSGAIGVFKNTIFSFQVSMNSGYVWVTDNVVTINSDPILDAGADYAIQVPGYCLTDLAGNEFAGISNIITWYFSLGM